MNYSTKSLLTGSVVALAMIVPVVSSAQSASSTATSTATITTTSTVSATSTQITMLLSQIDALKLQLSALIQQVINLGGIGSSTLPFDRDGNHHSGFGTSTSSMPSIGHPGCMKFERSIGLGMRGDDVKGIQEILAENDSTFPQSGVTGFFGHMTKNALKRMQDKFGITSTSVGFVGSTTRQFFNQECDGDSNNDHLGWDRGRGGDKQGDHHMMRGDNHSVMMGSTTSSMNTDEDHRMMPPQGVGMMGSTTPDGRQLPPQGMNHGDDRGNQGDHGGQNGSNH